MSDTDKLRQLAYELLMAAYKWRLYHEWRKMSDTDGATPSFNEIANQASVAMQAIALMNNRQAVEAMIRALADATERERVMREALENTSVRTDGDSLKCWCHDEMQSGLFAPDHTGWCKNARAALAATKEPT